MPDDNTLFPLLFASDQVDLDCEVGFALGAAADTSFNAGDWQQAHRLFWSALQSSNGNKKLIYQCLYGLATIYAREEKRHLVDYLYDRAFEIVSGVEALEAHVDAYFACIFWSHGWVERAFVLVKQIDASKKGSLPKPLLKLFKQIERDYRQVQKDKDELLKLATIEGKTVEPVEWEDCLDQAFGDLYDSENFESAKTNFTECAKSATTSGQKDLAMAGLAYAFWQLGSKDQADFAADQTASALSKTSDSKHAVSAINVLFQFHQLSNRPHRALEHYSIRANWPVSVGNLKLGFEELVRQQDEDIEKFDLELNLALRPSV